MEKLGEEVLAGSYDGGVYSVNKSGENSEFIRLFDQSENYHVLK